MYLFFLLVFLLAMVSDHRTECAPAVGKEEQPGQTIQKNPGYIPVYIREGDTPLEEINGDLAEAFRSYAYKHYKLDYVNVKNGIDEVRKAEDNLVLPEKKKKNSDKQRETR